MKTSESVSTGKQTGELRPATRMTSAKLGIERYYEDILHGQTGYEEVEVNNRGRVIRQLKRGAIRNEDTISTTVAGSQAPAVY